MTWMKWGTASGVSCEGLVFQQVEEKFCNICHGMLVCFGALWLVEIFVFKRVYGYRKLWTW